jgi:hypothetical protein
VPAWARQVQQQTHALDSERSNSSSDVFLWCRMPVRRKRNA